MKATLQTNNQATNIAINIETMKANIQSALQATKQRVLKELTLPRLYRKELRLARAIARAIDAHPTISNIALWLMGIGIMVEIFLFA